MKFLEADIGDRPIHFPTRNLRRIGRLHVITDTQIQSRYSASELAKMAIEGGADVIQYRNKTADFRVMVSEAKAVGDVCRAWGTLFIVNDSVQLCIDVQADGVHLGANDMPVREARLLLGDSAIIGATIRNVVDLQRAEADSADYVGLGPIYVTSSKSVDVPPLGLSIVREVTSVATIPIIAIAGITLGNVRATLDAGAYGVAVVSAVCCAKDVEAAARGLRQSID